MIERGDIRLYPLTKKQGDKMIRDWHSHHKPTQGWKFGIGARLATGEDLGCVIVGRPSAPALDTGLTWEVTRLCCRGGGQDKNLASMLLAAAVNASVPQGIRHMVSYTRQDEDGTCYKAQGWARVAEVVGKGWTSGNKSTRWLPGFYEPSTEIVDRVRWEKRPTEDIRAVVRLVFTLANLSVPRSTSRPHREAFDPEPMLPDNSQVVRSHARRIAALSDPDRD